ncbi:MAG: restriction endonuclease [delta proteobacterium ML8_D]|jgi:restriction system protein|nr:MAG: restriction endonuclease [delta proteobacterium ML8_D]
MGKQLAPTRALAAKLIHGAFTILHENGNEMNMKDLFKQIEKKISLDDWEKERYEKSGYIRWQSVLQFFSIDCIKAGYLIKKSGTWYLTPEGVEASKESPEKLLENASKAYKKWKSEQPIIDKKDDEVEETIEENDSIVVFSDIQEKAIEGLVNYINRKNPYEFQDLVAALLRGMGYYTPFIAPKGKDGGIDIIAYKDPLGTTLPRIQVQIKHRESSASVQEIRQLMGLLQKDGDVGLFISTGGFTTDAKNTARTSHVHVELIDQNRFIELWESFYPKLNDQDKSLLPLKPVYFLASDE